MKNNSINKEVPNLFTCEEECCGCSACFSICPVGAILMKEDNKGFIYPEIKANNCIKCFQCKRVCPI